MTKKIDSQNCKNLTFKVIFLRLKLSKSLRKKQSLKNINLGQQLLLKSFFDKFNLKKNLLLKLGCKIAIFQYLTTLFEKLQKIFWCNFCDSTSISFIVISFHQIPLTWWNAYLCSRDQKWNFYKSPRSKGQLISKCPDEKSVSSKIPMKIFLDFCPEMFCSFLGASW